MTTIEQSYKDLGIDYEFAKNYILPDGWCTAGELIFEKYPVNISDVETRKDSGVVEDFECIPKALIV